MNAFEIDIIYDIMYYWEEDLSKIEKLLSRVEELDGNLTFSERSDRYEGS